MHVVKILRLMVAVSTFRMALLLAEVTLQTHTWLVKAKISLSSTRDTCFPLLVSKLYPQETSLGTWWSDSAPAYDQQPHSTYFFSYKDHGNLSTPIFSCVGIRLFSPPMQTKSSVLLPPHIAEVGYPYVETTVEEVLTGYHVINLQKFMLHQYDHLHTLSNTNLELQAVTVYSYLWDESTSNFRDLLHSGDKSQSVMVVITVMIFTKTDYFQNLAEPKILQEGLN
ncbi:hypothetical protein YC2023_033709 [Brassica napus]